MKNPALLMQAFEFDQDSLQQNRLGRLTEMQEEKLKRRFWRTYLGFLVLGVSLLLLILVAIIIHPTSFLACLSIAFTAALFGPLVIGLLTMNADIDNATVKQVTGMIIVGTEYIGKGRQSYVVRIGDERFKVTGEEFFALENGQFYRLYYAPKTRIILSVEPSYPKQSK